MKLSICSKSIILLGRNSTTEAPYAITARCLNLCVSIFIRRTPIRTRQPKIRGDILIIAPESNYFLKLSKKVLIKDASINHGRPSMPAIITYATIFLSPLPKNQSKRIIKTAPKIKINGKSGAKSTPSTLLM